MGCTKIALSDTELASFYEGLIEITAAENEYILLENNNQIVDKYCFQDGKLRKLKFKQLDNNFTGIIKPRNIQQECAMDLLQDRTTPIKVLTGRFGSGKTLLMITHALDLIERGQFQKIVWVRNNIEVKNTIPLGSLPGLT